MFLCYEKQRTFWELYLANRHSCVIDMDLYIMSWVFLIMKNMARYLKENCLKKINICSDFHQNIMIPGQ